MLEARTTPDLPQPPKPIIRSKEANAAIVAGGAKVVSASPEAMPLIKEDVGVMPILVESLGRPAFIAALTTAAAARAIWVWRRQRLLERGT